MSPKISIITVCFNSVKTIADTLRSVREQTYENIEHIVIDGGSKDGTLDVIAREGTHVARLVSERDRGIYDAMNKGIALATGEIIGFINADDFYASVDAIQRVAEVFRHPCVDACYGDLCYVRPVDTKAVVRYWRAAEFKPGAFTAGWCPPHPTFFVRRQVYERFGNFDLSYRIAADVDLMIRFLEVQHVRVKYLPHVLVRMRMGGTTNRSLRNIARQNSEILRALKKNGFEANPLGFIGRKIISRGRQFIERPKEVIPG